MVVVTEVPIVQVLIEGLLVSSSNTVMETTVVVVIVIEKLLLDAQVQTHPAPQP